MAYWLTRGVTWCWFLLWDLTCMTHWQITDSLEYYLEVNIARTMCKKSVGENENCLLQQNPKMKKVCNWHERNGPCLTCVKKNTVRPGLTRLLVSWLNSVLCETVVARLQTWDVSIIYHQHHPTPFYETYICIYTCSNNQEDTHIQAYIEGDIYITHESRLNAKPIRYFMLFCILDRVPLNNHSAPMVYTGKNIPDGWVTHYRRCSASQRMADKAGATQASFLLFEASLVQSHRGKSIVLLILK